MSNEAKIKYRINPGDTVRHFKREVADLTANPNEYLYKVISTTARSTDDYTQQVVYMALYDKPATKDGDISIKVGDIFVRSYHEFMSEVDHNKYPDIKQKYRFEVVL